MPISIAVSSFPLPKACKGPRGCSMNRYTRRRQRGRGYLATFAAASGGARRRLHLGIVALEGLIYA